MRVLTGGDVKALASFINDMTRCDYVYMYPPRQAYRPFATHVDVSQIARRSLSEAPAINLYLHFPFCKQICSYCNLYAVPSRSGDIHKRYVRALLRELMQKAEILRDVPVRTVYFGGGTPSMLDPELLGSVLTNVSELLRVPLRGIREVAIEVAPDTATKKNLHALRQIGFNRVNVGVQTADHKELQSIGRRYKISVVPSALANALESGFANVCVDLIYGLSGQSFESWRRSVDVVAASGVETVCAYPLTLRPGTGFSRQGYVNLSYSEQYRKYDYVDSALQRAGYEQQTHVRWALPGRGGYLQKEYHWAGDAVVGIGAGARSYLHDLDLRNGYSLRRRREALDQYIDAMETGQSPVTDGFLMDDDERRRKAVILGLNGLDLNSFADRFGSDVNSVFHAEIATLKDLGLLVETQGVLHLSSLGVRHRDVAVQPFFSDRVRSLVAKFPYDE